MSTALLDLFGGENMEETKNSMFRPMSSTWSDPKKSGGYGWGQMSHAFAGIFFITNLEPEKIIASSLNSKTNVDYHDCGHIHFKNGTICSFSGTAGLPKHCYPQLEIKIYGEKGMLLLDFENRRERLEIRRYDKNDKTIEIIEGEGWGKYNTKVAIDRFIKMCNGEKQKNCGDHIIGTKVVKVLEAFYKSCKSGEFESCL